MSVEETCNKSESVAQSESESQELLAQRAAAQSDLDKGYAIIPLNVHDKTPLTEFAPRGFKSSRTKSNPTALAAWDAGIPANHAIDCGRSDLAVIDCDHGLQSFEEFEAWRKEYDLPETFCVRTGRRDSYGVQMYYKGAIPGSGKSGFKLGNVVGEIKSIGGYVAGVGSIHPISGEVYEVIVDKPTAPTPERIRQYKKLKSAEPSGPSEPVESAGIIVSEQKIIPAGQRNAALISLAGSLRNVQGGMLSEAAIYVVLKDAAIHQCEDGVAYAAKEDAKLQKMANDVMMKFDSRPIEQAPRLRMSYDEMLAEETATRQGKDVVQDLLTPMSVNTGLGDSGLGKTPALVQMGLCIAYGLPFIGQEVQRGRVLLVDYENFGRLRSLMGTLAGFLGIEKLDEEWITTIRSAPDRKAVAREIEDYRPSFVLVDSLRGFDSKADGKSQAAADLITWCQQISQTYNTTWMLIHHLRKGDSDPKKRPNLFGTESVRGWLQEAAGPLTIINQTNLRLGFAAPPKDINADLGMRGLFKLTGEVGPWYARRIYDDNDRGRPLGYVRAEGADLLSTIDAHWLEMLPFEPLPFRKVMELLEQKDSKRVSVFLKNCKNAKAILEDGKDHTTTKTYTRVRVKGEDDVVSA